jgi:hypothetical protein
MQHSTSRTAAQIGGLAVIVSLFLPWYKWGIPGFPTSSFKIWDSVSPLKADKGALDAAKLTGALFAVFGALAITQIRIGSAALMGRIFLFVGFALTVLVAYKIFKPPYDFLEIVKLKPKPSFGAYSALIGCALVTWSGWEQVKRDLAGVSTSAETRTDWQTTNSQHGAQSYVNGQTATQAQAEAQIPSVSSGDVYPVAAAAAQVPAQVAAGANGASQYGAAASRDPFAVKPSVAPDPFAPKPPASE